MPEKVLLLGNRLMVDVISSVRIRLPWSRMGPLSDMTGVLIRKGNLDANTHTGRIPCENEAQIRMMVIQIRTWQKLSRNHQKLRKGMEHILSHSP